MKGGDEMDMKLIGERINEARLEKGMTLQEVSEELGLTKSTIQRYEAGTFKRMKLPILEALANLLNVNPVWLMGKDVPKHGPVPVQTFPNLLQIGTATFPLYTGIACGEPLLMDERIETYVAATTGIKADFVLRAVGSSMEPGIRDGDLVFIRSQPQVENGQIAAVAVEDGATLKRVFWYPEKKLLILKADNPTFGELIYQDEEFKQVRVLGLAVAFQRDVT